jgi:tetratricopeptide (TPR) repeat protein
MGAYVIDANDMRSNVPPFCLPAYIALTDLSEALNMLVQVYQETKQYAEATPLLLLDLKIAEEAFGKGEPPAAAALLHLAEFYDKQDNYPEAERYYDRAVTIHMRAKNKSGSIPVLKQYAGMLRRMGRQERAAKLEALSESIKTSHR